MAELRTEERAIVAAVARTGRRDALAGLAPDVRARCEAAVTAAVSLPGDVPVGLADIHPTWIADEGPAIAAALAGRGAVSPTWLRWLRRRMYGHLVDMPAGLPADLAAEIEIVGRGRLALATRAAPAGAARRLASELGAAHARAFVDEVDALASAEDVRMAVRELGKLGGGPVLFAAGCRHVGPAIAALGGDWPRRVAQRLPRPLGERLLVDVRRGGPVFPGAAGTIARLLRLGS